MITEIGYVKRVTFIHIKGIMNRLVFRNFSRCSRLLNKPLKDSDKLYGKFTEEEYENASQYIKNQIKELEHNIKGETNTRENLKTMQSFPAATKKSIRIDNLSNLLEETIKTTGPISLSAYMRQCLTHPQFGYYTTRDPLDSKTGDFITSPEISSVFGEMIGIYFFQLWLSQGLPKEINVIEFGPGKGTLIHDAMSSFNRLNKYDIKINLILIETSKVLRKEQHNVLCTSSDPFNTDDNGFNYSVTKWKNDIKWVENESDIETNDIPNYIIAHEFFDALPIKSFQKTENGWRELLVEHSKSVDNNQIKLPGAETALDVKNSESFDTEFHLTMTPKETPSSKLPLLVPRVNSLPVGARIEICPDAEFFIKKMVSLIKNDSKKGGVLIIDYGLNEGVPDNTLRGIYKHQFVSPFFKPGEVDLSVNVDFESLKLLSEEFADPIGPVDQGDWLHEIGIGYRIDRLLKANEDNYNEQEKIYNSYKRLTDKDEKGMGKIYKFFGLLPKGSETPFGFKKL